MGMNTGMLFGKVESCWGPVKNVQVDITKLIGDSDQKINIQGSEDNENASTWVVTNDDGKYVLPFLWHGTEIAKAASVMRVHCFASGTHDKENLVRRAFLCMNLKALFSAVYPTFDSPTQEALDCAKDFIMAFRKVAQFPPHHKLLLSTELWGILAQANFFITAPK